jgi:electron-transferring-flavoprotein dehydrogenase
MPALPGARGADRGGERPVEEGRMSDVTREVLEVDVLFVGAGPACLAGAIRLAQLARAHDENVEQSGTGRKLGEINIAVIEKASEVGMHSLSGAVLDPRAIRELFPDFQSRGFPIEKPVETDAVHFLTTGGQFRLPITPPPLQNHGNFVVSLHKVTRWMAAEAEKLGVNIFAGFTGGEILYAGDRVVGVRTGDRGVDKHGQPKGNFEPGIDIRARATVLGEGPRGSLAKHLVPRLGLDRDSLPQIYATGVKELWRMPPGSLRDGRVLHTMGFPLPRDVYGGGWIYNQADDILSIGFVVGLDYGHPATDPHALFSRWKTHPFVAGLLQGGEMIAYGAKTIAEGGYWSMPRLYADGVLLVGETGGFLNSMRLKGIHLAMKSGMLAAEALLDALASGDTSAERLRAYDDRFRKSWAHGELYRVRNFRQGFRDGLLGGMLHTGLQLVTGGRGLFERRRMAPDYQHLRKLAATNGAVPAPVVFDDKLTFKKLTDVYHSGTVHEEDQPSHLQITEPDLCAGRCTEEYGNPCTHFCPASVYEMVDAPGGGRKLLVNFTNCVHCKTCDIMDPYQVINWVTPEGGGGPNYINM